MTAEKADPSKTAAEDGGDGKPVDANGKEIKMQKATFASADDMKKKLRENMHKPRYDVTNFYYETGCCQAIARNSFFENFTLGVISFNALWLSIDTDLNSAATLVDAHPVFIVAENAFCVFFTGELLVRFGSFARKINCMKDPWFCFDFLLVTMMVLETWVLGLVMLALGGGSGSGLGNSGLLKLMRLMRLSRMARIARLLRSMPELLILIKGMVAATRSVFVTLILLMGILYVFGIMFRMLAEGTVAGENFFPGVLSSMHSLVVLGILHNDVADVFAAIEEDSAYQLVPFYYFFVLLAALTVMNMLIGVLCEVITAVAECEHEEIQIMNVRDCLEDVVERQKKSQDGQSIKALLQSEEGLGKLRIFKEDFLRIMTDEKCTDLLVQVKVDPFGLVELVDTLFTTEDGDEKVLFFPDLVELVMDQRSCNIATVKDVTDLRKFVKGRLDKLDLSIKAQVLGMARLVERGLNIPRGTFEKELRAVADNCEQAAAAKTIQKMARGRSARKILAEKRKSQKDDVNGRDKTDGEAKPWEVQDNDNDNKAQL